MSDPLTQARAYLADASAHGANMSHVRGLFSLVPTGPVVAESLYLETCDLNRMLQDEIDSLRGKVEAERARWREAYEAEETLRSRERDRTNEWLTLLVDHRNAATWTSNGTAPAEDLAVVVARVDAALVRS